MTIDEAIKRLDRNAYRTTCYGNRVVEHEENLIAIQALRDIQQYREVGTVDECREARNKQAPKVPKLKLCGTIDCSDKDCVFCDRDVDRCPYCNEDLSIDCGLPYKYCPFCGQKLDWSDEE